ncbi:MAG: hypothetical protein HKN49_04910 [Gammaproteobacteria bacterium]|nr:hypothetical protein [Gammaproteobacteria bacterium]
MSFSIRQFNESLYVEHLEEASFIFEQRAAYLDDPEVTWLELGEWDNRLEAHLDALVVGGGHAVSVCDERRIDCDDGELHAIVRVYCRHRALSRIRDLFGELVEAENDTVVAVAQALRHEMPSEWRDMMHELAQHDSSQLRTIAAHVLGYRRLADPRILLQQLSLTNDANERREVAWALGRCGDDSAIAALAALLDDAEVAETAAVALMRLGHQQTVKTGHLALHQQAWPRRTLSLGAGPGAAQSLIDVIGFGDTAIVDSLGILGELSAVRPLLDCLSQEPLAAAAANALNTITGADLYEDQFVADDFDPDELFDHERELYEADGTVPTRDGETPFGSDVAVPTCDRERWETWLAEHRNGFRAGVRHRLGQSFSPRALLDTLTAEQSSHALRVAAYEELVIRYRLAVPFEADLPVPLQQGMLNQIAQWINQLGSQFEAGRWYFNGQIVS